MKLYQLNPKLQFVDVTIEPIPAGSVSQYADLQKVMCGELFLLRDEEGDKVMLVNPVIHAFLQEFKMPQSLENATDKLAEVAGCTANSISKKTQQFFNNMREREILIHFLEEKEEVAITSETPTFVSEQIVDNYQIVDCIREKSRIAIYEAIRLEDKQRVAIKLVLLPTTLSKKRKKKRLQVLQQEFTLLQELQGHPNICQFYDLVQTDMYNYAVMEYLDGYSLGRFVKYKKPNISTKISLAEQFLSAMSYIHEKGILHGDLHSGNIIIETGNTLKIIDLDLANHANLQEKEIQREGGVIHYIPPERISSTCFDTVNCPADFQSEVFQAGIILYRLIYEKMPFNGFTWRDLTRAIKTEEVQLLPTTPDGEPIPPVFILLLKKAMAKSRENRFTNAKEMFQFLLASFQIATPNVHSSC